MNELYARSTRTSPGNIGVAAYQQQDPDTLRLHTPLLAAVGCGLRLRPLHGNRFSSLCSSLFPARNPLPLQRSETTGLSPHSNVGNRPSRRPLILSYRQNTL